MSYERALRLVERLTADLAKRNRRVELCLGPRSLRRWPLSVWLTLPVWDGFYKEPVNDNER